ncbi:MAG: DUF4097 domain-containing protein, partial [Treponema sp.]|nr:DUF4097 domain-containing protein [Treponema sp.]
MKSNTVKRYQQRHHNNRSAGVLRGIILAILATLPLCFARGEETERRFSMAGINTLSINYDAGKIRFYVIDSESLVLRENLQRMKNAEVKIEAGTPGSQGTPDSQGILSITSKKEGWTPFWLGWKNDVSIAIPRSFQGNLRVNLTSGSLTGESDFAVGGNIDMALTSGSVTVRGMSGRRITLRLTSGSCRAETLRGETDMALTSGSISCGELSGPSHRLSMTSGSAKLGRVSGTLDAHVISGGITADFAELSGDLRFRANSGTIRLSLPRGQAFNLDAETSSGNIKIASSTEGYEIRNRSSVIRPIGQNPRHTIYARVNSGNITIE